MKSILVVNVNWLGDVIFSSPVFKALRKANPESRIVCMAVPRVREILECIEDVDEIIEYDEDNKHRGIFAKLKLVGYLKREKFDQVFLLSRSFSRASMMALAKIPIRVGYENKKRGKWLTHVTRNPDLSLHRSDYYLNVIEDFGVPVNDRTTGLTVSDQLAKSNLQMLRNNGVNQEDYTIVINAGGNWDLKRWPKASFAKLINIIGHYDNVKIIMSGSDNDKDLVAGILDDVSKDVKPIVLTGKLTLKELMALLKNVDVFVSADSGPLHIASSVGCASIGIFGPTRPELTGPRGIMASKILQKDVGCNKAACYHLKCSDNICMQAITVRDVCNAIKKIQSP